MNLSQLLHTIALCVLIAFPSYSQIFLTANGEIAFTSDAPLELIEASSNRLKGAIDAEKRTFAFSIPMRSFEGFNSSLQREHFNENYMESEKFPESVFKGKIIEKIDLTVPGKHRVRAKGQLLIHGIEQERIIRGNLTVGEDGSIAIKVNFIVPLADHDIKIPQIVYRKIATEIEVIMNAQLEVKNN